MKILPNHWVGISEKRTLPVLADVPDDSVESCANCRHRAVDDKHVMLLSSNGMVTNEDGQVYCVKHGWLFPTEIIEQQHRCKDYEFVGLGGQVLDCLDDPPVRRCTQCHRTLKQHTEGDCLEFTPGQPTLAQVMAYCGMDPQAFRHWLGLVLGPERLRDKLQHVVAKYLLEFSDDGYDRDTFVDWALTQLHQGESGFRLEQWYKRAATRLAVRYSRNSHV